MVPNAFNLRNQEAEASGSRASANLVCVVEFHSYEDPVIKEEKEEKIQSFTKRQGIQTRRGLWNQLQKQDSLPLF